tara:strand:- start:141 stop:527 length:387 start_codon:yes stop_codon:yes gene_type:complete
MSFFSITSCEEENNQITTPNIIFENLSNENFIIGDDINISILVNHEEVLDNVKYYEILNCSDDNFDSLSLLEWENIYELEWSYEKTIETDYLPEDIICTCTIQVEATDLNNAMSQTEISITISNDFLD